MSECGIWFVWQNCGFREHRTDHKELIVSILRKPGYLDDALLEAHLVRTHGADCYSTREQPVYVSKPGGARWPLSSRCLGSPAICGVDWSELTEVWQIFWNATPIS